MKPWNDGEFRIIFYALSAAAKQGESRAFGLRAAAESLGRSYESVRSKYYEDLREEMDPRLDALVAGGAPGDEEENGGTGN